MDFRKINLLSVITVWICYICMFPSICCFTHRYVCASHKHMTPCDLYLQGTWTEQQPAGEYSSRCLHEQSQFEVRDPVSPMCMTVRGVVSLCVYANAHVPVYECISERSICTFSYLSKCMNVLHIYIHINLVHYTPVCMRFTHEYDTSWPVSVGNLNWTTTSWRVFRANRASSKATKLFLRK